MGGGGGGLKKGGGFEKKGGNLSLSPFSLNTDSIHVEPLIMDTLNKGHNRKSFSIKDTL